MNAKQLMKPLTALVLAIVASALPVAASGEIQPFVRGSWKAIRAAHAGRPVACISGGHLWAMPSRNAAAAGPVSQGTSRSHPRDDQC
jgi:hypothetical protein